MKCLRSSFTFLILIISIAAQAEFPRTPVLTPTPPPSPASRCTKLSLEQSTPTLFSRFQASAASFNPDTPMYTDGQQVSVGIQGSAETSTLPVSLTLQGLNNPKGQVTGGSFKYKKQVICNNGVWSVVHHDAFYHLKYSITSSAPPPNYGAGPTGSYEIAYRTIEYPDVPITANHFHTEISASAHHSFSSRAGTYHYGWDFTPSYVQKKITPTVYKLKTATVSGVLSDLNSNRCRGFDRSDDVTNFLNPIKVQYVRNLNPARQDYACVYTPANASTLTVGKHTLRGVMPNGSGATIKRDGTNLCAVFPNPVTSSSALENIFDDVFSRYSALSTISRRAVLEGLGSIPLAIFEVPAPDYPGLSENLPSTWLNCN